MDVELIIDDVRVTTPAGGSVLEAARQARLAVEALAGELKERHAELRAHPRATSSPPAAEVNTVASPGCRMRTSTSGARCAA